MTSTVYRNWNWCGLVWPGTDWVGLGWDGLGWDGVVWAGTGRLGVGWGGVAWCELGWIGVGWFGTYKDYSIFFIFNNTLMISPCFNPAAVKHLRGIVTLSEEPCFVRGKSRVRNSPYSCILVSSIYFT